LQKIYQVWVLKIFLPVFAGDRMFFISKGFVADSKAGFENYVAFVLEELFNGVRIV